ncbi:hypothetical protein E3Q23_03008 [Wallemia mellicola]|uniref:Cytochrome c oxidase subunit 8, mitochondrial n=1 Tax=Wallemia mellicola TaxID=1708541 RepID=A0A4T0LTW2_9BASI|nr:hypothetical protein E3Q23_03008 [Wallemia mellicola]TIB73662.1 hypothetical protein E3Q24_01012 [Wallemia mellicola]TIB90456.1 hypothetical protein E3Q21_00325 [Wallemia mellicola]TIB92154.1 hypothetical protein E3Q20_00355 [Wallemia mellicola]TIC04642.1 hypothetical protein E3Q17_00189 [Wallemia mellicola]
MSLIAGRPAFRQIQQIPRGIRSVHIENKVHDTMPFRTNGGGFGAKLAVVSIIGFGTPFFAAWYHGHTTVHSVKNVLDI